MLNHRRLRHNDVVQEREHDGMIIYGRVWRRIDADHVVVINTWKNVLVYHEDELVLCDYKGYSVAVGPVVYPVGPDGETDWFSQPLSRPTRFVPMTSLRHLKAIASAYDASFGGHGRYGHRWTKAERADAIANPTRFVPPSKRNARKTQNRKAA